MTMSSGDGGGEIIVLEGEPFDALLRGRGLG
jgi:hypothetical protein